MAECQQTGRTVAKGRKPTIYVSGGWLYRCSCGATVKAHQVGWGKNKVHGLLVPAHERPTK